MQTPSEQADPRNGAVVALRAASRSLAALASLASSPRVYLVPAGGDRLRVSNSAELAVREWDVVEQRIPAPFIINQFRRSADKVVTSAKADVEAFAMHVLQRAGMAALAKGTHQHQHRFRGTRPLPIAHELKNLQTRRSRAPGILPRSQCFAYFKNT